MLYVKVVFKKFNNILRQVVSYLYFFKLQLWKELVEEITGTGI